MVHASMNPLLAVLVTVAVLLVGAYLTTVIDLALGGLAAGRGPRAAAALTGPAERAALLLRQTPSSTERPDVTLWAIAPAVYAAIAAVAFAVIPLGEGVAVADVRTGIVVFGAAEVLTMVAVYLHGWSANSPLSLIGGYRFLAQGLSFLLISMFVLIAAALPAESLSVGRIVEAQRPLWNVVRQPLGLPLFLVVGLGAAFWGPANLPDSLGLAGGTSAEVSGPQRLSWEVARRAMLTVYAVMGAAVFLGGHLGPWLPGPVWLALKSLGVLVLLVGAGHVVGRVPPERFVSITWTVLLPLSFLDLAIAGVVALA